MNRPILRRLAALGATLLATGAAAGAQLPVQTPLESDAALEGLLPAPAGVARARIGDRLGQVHHELLLGPTFAAPTVSKHFGWKNGKAVSFRLTYDGFGKMTFVVGPKILTFATQGPFDAIGVRASSGVNAASVRVEHLSLNQVALPLGAFAIGGPGVPGLDLSLIQGATLQGGFVLRGEVTLQWSGVAPLGSELALELRAGRLAEMGRDYCASTVNSNGTACDLTWAGTTSLSTEDLELRATGGVPGGACLFLAGGTAQALPFGNGWLCAGPPLDRFEPVLAFDSVGHVFLPVDFAAAPLGSGALEVVPGDRRYIQLWYRDAAALPDTTNFSDALELIFVP